MNTLPTEIQNHIYEFNAEHREKFKSVLKIIPTWRDCLYILYKDAECPNCWNNDKKSIFYFDNYTDKGFSWSYDRHLFECGYGEKLSFL